MSARALYYCAFFCLAVWLWPALAFAHDTDDPAERRTHDLYSGQQWHLPMLGLPGAWQLLDADDSGNETADHASQPGDADVVVAILDDGFQMDHQDMAAANWIWGPDYSGTYSNDIDGDETANWEDPDLTGDLDSDGLQDWEDPDLDGDEQLNQVDEDMDGDCLEDQLPEALEGAPRNDAECPGQTQYLDDLDDGRGADLDPSPPAPNAWSHGTSVSGMIAAQKDNGLDLVGIAPGISVLAVRCACGPYQLAEGIDYVLAYQEAHPEKKVVAINMSWSAEAPEPALEDALTRAREAGIVPVCAAGNSGIYGVFWPGRYEQCLTVGGVMPGGEISLSSSTGADVDISAPSVRYTALANNHGRTTGDGTSLAAPLVAGAIGLLVSADPENVTALDAEQTLLATATDAGPDGQDDHYGIGIMHVARALGAGESSPEPVCTDRLYETWVGYPVSMQLTCGLDPEAGVLSWCNVFGQAFWYLDCQPQEQTLTIQPATMPTRGTLAGMWDESIIDHRHELAPTETYVPTAAGEEFFTYRATNGARTSAAATVQITIHETPTIACTSAPALNVASGTTGSLTFSCSTTGPRPIDLQLVEAPSQGAVTWTMLSNVAQVNYAAPAGFTGTLTFKLRATDDITSSAAQIISVTVSAPQQDQGEEDDADEESDTGTKPQRQLLIPQITQTTSAGKQLRCGRAVRSACGYRKGQPVFAHVLIKSAQTQTPYRGRVQVHACWNKQPAKCFTIYGKASRTGIIKFKIPTNSVSVGRYQIKLKLPQTSARQYELAPRVSHYLLKR